MFLAQLFSVLNTAVLVGVFYIAYQRYLRPKVMGELQKKSADTKQSILEKYELAEQLKTIAVKRNEREVVYRKLSEKVVAWKKTDAAALEQRAKDAERIRLSVENRGKEQYARMIEMRIKARIVPQALAKARLELYDHFHEAGVGETYINQIFAELKKVSHGQGN